MSLQSIPILSKTRNKNSQFILSPWQSLILKVALISWYIWLNPWFHGQEAHYPKNIIVAKR